MVRTTFRRPHDADELNRGEGMEVHPVSGEPLRYLDYDRRSQRFIRLVAEGAWDPSPEAVPLPPIVAEGMSFAAGDPFPSHWAFDPYTGRSLGRRETAFG